MWRQNLPTRWRIFRDLLISCFVVLNVVTVLHANYPAWATKFSTAVRSMLPSSQAQYRYDYAGWLLLRYAHVVGLDNRWQMFGRQPRFDWWYEITGTAGYGQETLFKLPNQGKRTLAEHFFFDFREAKYHLNLYSAPDLRLRYAHYLCREEKLDDGSKPRAVIFRVKFKNLHSRQDAYRLNQHLYPNVVTGQTDTFSCP